MLFGDIFDDTLDSDESSGPPMYSMGFPKKKESKFFKLYNVFSTCHLVQLDGSFVNYKLHDIDLIKESTRILDISELANESNTLHVFDIGSFFNAKINNHSVVLVNQKKESVKLIPCQLRSMISNGKIE
jgi:hypothetical protein